MKCDLSTELPDQQKATAFHLPVIVLYIVAGKHLVQKAREGKFPAKASGVWASRSSEES